MSGRTPDFLILGEAKCGTTTLWELLSRHPRVFFPADKELHFFSSYATWSEQGRYETDGLAPYAARFEPAGAEQLCGEATPTYLADAGACERIHSALPDARLIVILRDPVERAWSQYWHQVRRGRETLDFERALESEAERLATGDPDARNNFDYAARGRYVDNLRRYAEAFGRDALCVVFLEDLRREPGAVMAQVCAHLGVEPLPATALTIESHANRAEFPRWPQLDAATRSLRRWAETRAQRLVKPIRALGRATRALRVYSGTPRMSPATASRLRESYAASDHELAAWLGRTPPWLDAAAPNSAGRNRGAPRAIAGAAPPAREPTGG